MIAQEFFRLLNPSVQPSYMVLVEDKVSLDPDIPFSERFKSVACTFVEGSSPQFQAGEGYINLGYMQVGCLLVKEVNFKKENTRLTPYGLAKIDGDWCFAHLFDDRFSGKLTAQHFTNLPFGVESFSPSPPAKYDVWNWLAHSQAGVFIPRSDPSLSFLHRIQRDESYRLEVNQAILKILLWPDAFIQNFVGQYTTEDPKFCDRVTKDLILRKREFLEIATKDASFIKYFKERGLADKKQFANEICEFTVLGKKLIKDDSVFFSDVDVMYGMIQEKISKAPPSIPSASPAPPSLLDAVKEGNVEEIKKLFEMKANILMIFQC